MMLFCFFFFISAWNDGALHLEGCWTVIFIARIAATLLDDLIIQIIAEIIL